MEARYITKPEDVVVHVNINQSGGFEPVVYLISRTSSNKKDTCRKTAQSILGTAAVALYLEFTFTSEIRTWAAL